MKVYAITCDAKRMERLRHAADPLHLEILSVQSPLYTDEEVKRRGKNCFARETGYPTGVAATLGHIRAMKQIVESGDDFGIIVEDDVRFHKDFNNTLPVIELYMKTHNIDIFSMGFCSIPCHELGNFTFFHGIPIMENTGIANPWGAQGYVISKQYAKYFSDLFSIDDVSIPYNNQFVTDYVIFDPALGCKRTTMFLPVIIESPDEQSIAGNNNKYDFFRNLKRSDFYL
jgi:GR25 family glycosyltransferase involved in LPS biosynthesis